MDVLLCMHAWSSLSAIVAYIDGLCVLMFIAGAGQVTTIQRTPFGAFQSQQICATCRGQGQEYEEYCSVCRGKGSTAETAEVTLNVPAGTAPHITRLERGVLVS